MRYEKYKSSSIKWLKPIPSHWEEIRGKNLYCKESRAPREKDDIVTCFRDGQVTLRKNRRTEGFTESLKEIGYQGVRKGDLVIHVMDAFAGSIGVSDSDGKSTPVYSVCTAKRDINNYYYGYLLREMARTGYIQSLYRGIRERSSDFRFDVFAAQTYPVPPREEQDQIVRYLDWQVSKINKLIHGYQRQIKLLQEKAQKLTCSAVLHGIDETVVMKSSGIQNIESIPEHWRVLQNKRIFAERTEFSETGKETLLSVSKHYGVKPYYALEDSEQFATIKPAESLVGYKKVRKNDVAMNIMRARNGSFGVSEYDGIVSPAYAVFRPIIECNPRYMHYLLRTPHVIGIFESYSYGIAEHRRRLYAVDFLRLHLPVPPVNEQNGIVQYVESIQEETKKISDKIQKEIELLREYRTRLISDVVTGQMDVRGIVIPEYTPENDTEDITDTENAADEEVPEDE